MSTQRGATNLVALEDDLLLAILRLVPQRELLKVVPLVCKRLDSLLKRGSELWRTVTVDVPGGSVTSQDIVYLQRWFADRRGSIEELSLQFSRPWVSAIQPVLWMIGSSLRSLDLQCHSRLAEPEVQLLLAPLQHTSQLTNLKVLLHLEEPIQQAALPDLSALTGLQHLYWCLVANPFGCAVPAGVQQLTALTSLFLKLGTRQRLPLSHSQLVQLQKLEVQFYPLEFDAEEEIVLDESLVAVLSQLTALTHLNVRHINAATIDAIAWGKLSGLQHLDLCGCELRALPQQLTVLSQLQSLHLTGNDLEPAGSLQTLRHLTSVENLNLACCALTSLPQELSCMTWLNTLCLADNPELLLTSADVRLTLAQLLNLEHIYLHGVQDQHVHPSDWAVLLRACPKLTVYDDSEFNADDFSE